MCDYSLQHMKSRPAKVGDKLIIKNFGTGTRGFASVDDAFSTEPTAVCVLPGTELAFDADVSIYGDLPGAKGVNGRGHKTAIFRQINKEQKFQHHDVLEFADGSTSLLTFLTEGQTATVLQLPAAPKNEAEVEEQRRAEFV